MTKRHNLRIAIFTAAALAFGLSSALATTPSIRPSTTGSTTTKHKPSAHSSSKAKSSATKSGSRTRGSKASTAKSSPAKSSPAVKSTGSKSATSSKASKTGKHSAKAAQGGRQRGQMAPTSDRISEIQGALAKNGAMDGSPTGKWDESTTEAMRKYQAAHGLNPSGKLDALTLRQLGLGSSTAGLAPPAPVARTTSTNLPADIQQ